MESTKQVSNELQQRISQLTKLMTWLLIGGAATLGMVLLKLFTGEFDPVYHSIEAALGVYCLASWGKSYYDRQKLMQKLQAAKTAPDSVYP
ncbi:TPA: hypothetical protein ACKP1B_000253 [Serratia fonticola]